MADVNMIRLRWAERSRTEKGSAILAFSVVFLQKLGFGLFGNYVGLDNFILIGVLIWLFASGDAVIDLTRFLLFGVLFITVCLSLYLTGNVQSLPALIVMFSMYAMLLFRVDVDQASLMRCVKTFQTCMVWIAVIIILQQIIQYTIGNRYWPNLDALLPKSILVGDYMYLRPVTWRSPYLVPQGVFTLEPSVASGFLAVAVAAEIIWFKRMWHLGLYALAVLISGAGSGLTSLTICAVPLFFHMDRKLRRRIILLGIPATIALMLSGALDHYLDRSSEFTNRNSSAYWRIIVPLEELSRELADPDYVFAGNGPGTSIEKMTIPAQKMLYEYGLLATLAFHAYMLTAVLRRSPSRTIGVLLVAPHLLFGGGFVTHTNIMMLVMLGSLMSVPALKLLPLGHHPIPRPSPIRPQPMVGKHLA
jgi:hypothetical protein